MVELITSNGLFGIMEDGKHVVPLVHKTKDGAIEEWECFEKINSERLPHKKFLPKNRTIEEIDEIVLNLKSKMEEKIMPNDAMISDDLSKLTKDVNDLINKFKEKYPEPYFVLISGGEYNAMINSSKMLLKHMYDGCKYYLNDGSVSENALSVVKYENYDSNINNLIDYQNKLKGSKELMDEKVKMIQDNNKNK